MTDSARAPLGGDQSADDRDALVMGYAPLAKFLTSRGFPISKSSLQKIGMPSAGGGGPPVSGYWGNLPVFRQDRALDWARSRIRRFRGKAAPTTASPVADLSTQPIADTAAKGAFRTPPCGSPAEEATPGT